MKRFSCVFLGLCILFALFSGCSESETTQNRGITTIGGYTCYKINLSGRDVESYFTPIESTLDMVNVSIYEDSMQSMRDVYVYFCEINEGGWIAYHDSLVIYLPSAAGKENARKACALFVSLSSNSCMSIGEARGYIPWL